MNLINRLFAYAHELKLRSREFRRARSHHNGKVHVMIDLETLGSRPGCKILSIGAVVFGPAGLDRSFYVNVDRMSQSPIGLREDPDTIKWWSEQNEAARRAVFDVTDAVPVRVALHRLTDFLTAVSFVDDVSDRRDVCVWGNGAGFDQPILAAVFHADGIPKLPWKFWNERCYRTLKNSNHGVPYVHPKIAHHALEDAKAQARHLVRILNRSENGWE
jgi:hypothetical protein